MSGYFSRTGKIAIDDALARMEAAYTELGRAAEVLRGLQLSEDADALDGFCYAIAFMAKALH
jgi:hypothetical protein